MPKTLSVLRDVMLCAACLTIAAASPNAVRADGGDADEPAEAVRLASPMSVPRAAHTATTLTDGRVLVVGGFTNAANAAQGAELFDPRTERFSPASSMITLRHSHTATLLPNGRVLIAGGYAAGTTTVAATELFDPATNSFVRTGTMRAARAGHVAVLLATGKVLLAGGIGPGWSFLSSVELYDPASGTFATTGAMRVARESHVAVQLPDSRVLIVGGHQGRRANITLYASAETYDITSGRFSRVGDMRVRRHKHDAVLLADGRVMVTGGADERDSDGVYRSTELFDPASDSFVAGPSMILGRYKHQGNTVLLQDGRVLLAGGAPQAEIFDPRTRRFDVVSGAPRMAGQFSAAARLGGGRVLITGGYGNGGGPRESAWLFRD